MTHKNLKKRTKNEISYEDYQSFVSEGFYCGFAVFGDFLRGFSASNRTLRPLIDHADSWEIKVGYFTVKRFEKFSLKFSRLSFAIRVNFLHPCSFMFSIIISLLFFYLSKVLFSGFLQFKNKFVRSQNNSKYRNWYGMALNNLTRFPISASIPLEQR